MVIIEDEISNSLKIITGIPLGTVLVHHFIHNMLEFISELNIDGNIISYADDPVLLFDDDSSNETKITTEKGNVSVKNWRTYSRQLLNIKKTTYIAFTMSNAIRSNFKNIQNGTNYTIDESQNTKYLVKLINW